MAYLNWQKKDDKLNNERRYVRIVQHNKHAAAGRGQSKWPTATTVRNV